MWACLIQCPVVVTCPSAQSIGRKRDREGREGWSSGEEDGIEIQPPSSPLGLRNLRPQPRPETFPTGRRWKERHKKGTTTCSELSSLLHDR